MNSTPAGTLHHPVITQPRRSRDAERHQPLSSGRSAAKAIGTGLCSQRAAVALPAHERHVVTARRFAAAVLADWAVVGDDRALAVLIVSELATNAVLHGRSDMIVNISLTGRILQIDVTDRGRPATQRQESGARTSDECGRGLGIVDCLADRTETHRGPQGWRIRAVLEAAHGIVGLG